MNRRLNDLFLQQGRLIERIAGQREALQRGFGPVAVALGRIDFAVTKVRFGVKYLSRHVLLTSVLAGTFLIFKGKTALRWTGRAFSLWKSWRTLRNVLFKQEYRVRW
jgi:hypothetical protein